MAKRYIYRFEPCQINMKMKNLNNKQIIKINDLKFKKTPGMINFAKQIKFITQKKLLNTRSIYKNGFKYLSVILEDEKRSGLEPVYIVLLFKLQIIIC